MKKLLLSPYWFSTRKMGLRKFLLFLTITFLFTQCTSYKKIVYFNDIRDSSTAKLGSALSNFEQPIQKNDLLSIRISSLNPQDNLILNPNQGSTTGSNFNYLVNQMGFIKIPLIGEILAEGKKIPELELEATNRLKDFSKDPIVTIRFANLHITVLGDVEHPGELLPTTDRFTILEALGEAGDLKVTARRDNILVIREENGKRNMGRLNLTSKNIFQSPYFYLKPRDVIYVEPVKASYSDRNDFISKYIGVGASLISIIVSIILLTRK